MIVLAFLSTVTALLLCCIPRSLICTLRFTCLLIMDNSRILEIWHLLWEREDRGVEEVSTEIGNQRRKKRRIEQARFVLPVGRPVNRWRRPVDRPVDRRAQEHSGRSPGRPWKEAVDRPIDRLTCPYSRLGLVDRRGRPAGRPTDAF